MSQKKYVLIVEWFDPSASLIKQFYFNFYLPNNQIQMYDIKNHKVFLKKIAYPQVGLKDLYIGNVLVCYNRQLKIVDFGDDFTRKQLLGGEVVANKTYGMIKPDAYLSIGKVLSIVQENFTISNLKMFKFSLPEAQQFYAEHKEKPFFSGLVEFMISDYAVGMELVAHDAIKKWRGLLGPTNSATAREQVPNSIRAKFGTDGRRNCCHGSDSSQSADRQLNHVFSSKSTLKPNPHLSNCTLCIIKPHIIKGQTVGKVIDAILEAGFEISAMQMVFLDAAVADEFYQVYKFLPECKRMIDQLSSGPAIAMEVRQENAVESFRKFVGPFDPEIARKLQPNTLRAQFGKDRVLNCIHCTDLPEDGTLEVQYIFETVLS